VDGLVSGPLRRRRGRVLLLDLSGWTGVCVKLAKLEEKSFWPIHRNRSQIYPEVDYI